MKAVHISKKSWHYRFLRKFGFHPYEADDLCTYLNKLFFGILAFIVISLLILVLFGASLIGVYLFSSSYVNLKYSWIPTILVMVGLGIWYLYYLIKLFSDESLYITHWRMGHHPDGSFKTWIERQREWTSDKKPSDLPSFYKAAWRSFKDKVCFRLEIE